ncbi:cell division control protein 42 homolog [Acanthaster planci]|uniref:Cell division control protein 42 homolog n=1 Tax=Acanthaster planci TaxID=133434 RepID=A0A8B7Y0E0_ACAPL|nr:cell division control protein 42 homolog [Acanthaster planci]XP_022085977.1 cell division control protein 42 homolog [Acanthaster planci]
MVLTGFTKEYRDLETFQPYNPTASSAIMPPQAQSSTAHHHHRDHHSTTVPVGMGSPKARGPTTTSNIFRTDSANEEDIDTKVKCVLIGDGAVGKTSLVVSYTTNGYPLQYVPTAFDNYSVVVRVDRKPIKIQICDTAGQDDFDSLRPLCYPQTDVFLLCFSVVSPTSFHNILEKWLPEVRRHNPKTPIILVGTQCDLRTDVNVLIDLAKYQERPITEEEAIYRAQRINAVSYVECSALTQHNLKDVFDTVILTALQFTGPPKGKGSSKSKGSKAKSSKAKKEKPVPSQPKSSIWKKLCCIV